MVIDVRIDQEQSCVDSFSSRERRHLYCVKRTCTMSLECVTLPCTSNSYNQVDLDESKDILDLRQE